MKDELGIPRAMRLLMGCASAGLASILTFVGACADDEDGGDGSPCPLSYAGCSSDNLCTSCDDTCVYCQDLNESYCGPDDCMTCQPDLTLHVLWDDGTGECLP